MKIDQNTLDDAARLIGRLCQELPGAKVAIVIDLGTMSALRYLSNATLDEMELAFSVLLQTRRDEASCLN